MNNAFCTSLAAKSILITECTTENFQGYSITLHCLHMYLLSSLIRIVCLEDAGIFYK